MLINNISKSFETIVANFTGNIRHDSIGGRPYLVAPMVMMVEGVLSGTIGPVLYKAEDMEKFPAAWNNKPVTVYHPPKGLSACDPNVLTTQGIGIIMNARVEEVEDGKQALKAEAWFEEERANAVDARIMEAVSNNKPMELSTGLFVELENEAGELDGKDYLKIAHNFQPDHLALLPDMKGASSLADGAGFLMNKAEDAIEFVLETFSDEQKSWLLENQQLVFHTIGDRLTEFIDNQMSHSSIRSLLQSLLQTTNDMLWIDEVFDSFFIYEDDGKLWKQSYTITDNAVTFVGDRTEVVRVTEFRTKDGEFIGNRKEQQMDKNAVIDALIANTKTKWGEEHREVLMAMSEEVLGNIDTPTAETLVIENTEVVVAETPAAEGEQTENLSMKQYIDQMKAPNEMKAMLRNSVKMHDVAKDALIEDLVANEKCTFTPEYLRFKDLEELQNLHQLAGCKPKNADQQVFQRFNYEGQAGGSVQNVQLGGEPLAIEPVVSGPVVT